MLSLLLSNQMEVPTIAASRLGLSADADMPATGRKAVSLALENTIVLTENLLHLFESPHFVALLILMLAIKEVIFIELSESDEL